MPTDSWKTIVPSSAGYIVHGPKGFACTISTYFHNIYKYSLLPSNSVENAKCSKCVLSVDGIAFCNYKQVIIQFGI